MAFIFFIFSLPFCYISVRAIMENHNKSAIDEESSKTTGNKAVPRWPVTFPKIKSSYKLVTPTVNEPIILRYNAKALFNSDCENLTFGKYKSLNTKSQLRLPKQLSQKSSNRYLVDTPETTETSKNIPKTDQQAKKMVLMEQGRSRLFSKFPEVKTIFTRHKQPVNYLKRSMEYEF
jgi:hypothetical protein